NTRGAQAVIRRQPSAVNLISAKTHRVVGHVPLGKRASTQFASFDVARDGHFAWVLDAPDQTLLRIDLATLRRDRDVRLPWAPDDRIAVGGGMVWARRNGAPQVIGISARTGRVVRRFSVPGNGIGIAFG